MKFQKKTHLKSHWDLRLESNNKKQPFTHDERQMKTKITELVTKLITEFKKKKIK